MGLAAIVVACGNTNGGPSPSGPQLTAGVVNRVADGDTIEVTGTGEVIEVRLVALNAPDQGECFTDEARDHLIETLRDRAVLLEIVGEDQFGRALAHVFEGDRHVNLELVEMGLALASTPEESDRYGPAMLQAEDDAYDSGRGLWADTACGTGDPAPEVVIDPDQSVFDPTGPDEQNLMHERLALRNQGSEPVDLAGWVIRDESSRHRFTFAGEFILASYETLSVSSSDQGWEPGGGPVWNNGGDMALLLLSDGTVVARWRY